jgi:tetratricopeptide (TPR) repeat protein
MGLTRDFARVPGRWLCLLALVATLFTPHAAQAQDARARARAAFAEGVSAYEAGRYREALTSFEQAYRAAPHPAVRVNMANCFEQLGQYVEALFNFRRYLEESGEAVDEQQRAEVEIAIARLTPRVATLVLSLEPRSATVTIDGKEPRRTPDGHVQVVAGVHALRVAAPGFSPIERSIEARGGTETPLLLTLEPEGALPLDGPLAEQPLVEEPAPEPVLDKELAAVDEPPRKQSRVLLWSAVSATGLFAIGAGVAGGIALKADSDFEDAQARSQDPSLSQADQETARFDGVIAADRANNAALMADIFIGATVVAGVATLWIWLRGRKQGAGDEASLSVRPLWFARAPEGALRHGHRHGGGLGLEGRF